jgi:hypothetical protein
MIFCCVYIQNAFFALFEGNVNKLFSYSCKLVYTNFKFFMYSCIRLCKRLMSLFCMNFVIYEFFDVLSIE